MKRTHLLLSLSATTATALVPLALLGQPAATAAGQVTHTPIQAPVSAPAAARGAAPASREATALRVGHAAGRPDPTFGPAARHAAVARLQASSGATAARLGLGAAQHLVVSDVLRDTDGTRHVRYQRTYAGLPVVGGDLVVETTPSGEISVNRANPDPITVPTTTAVLPAAAARSLAVRAEAAGPADDDRSGDPQGEQLSHGSDVTGLAASGPAPVKVVYAVHHRPVLAWQTLVTGQEEDGTPVRDLVYTDATSGRTLGRLPQVMESSGPGYSLYSGKVTVHSHRKGGTYQLVDDLRGGMAVYGKGNEKGSSRGTLFTDANNHWGNGSTTGRESAAVDAAYGAAQTWDFYASRFGRRGIRGDGDGAYSRVHYGAHFENAYWDDSCFCMTYGDGGQYFKPLVSLDVAGHEMTHGVTAATAGLAYAREAGGLNESTSDVMGTMVEFAAKNPSDPGDFYIGENVVKGGGWLRRMDKPSRDGASVDCWSSTVHTLDPHYSSGVGNHLFYLLSEGTGSRTFGGLPHSSTACNGATLTGIGRTDAAAIWYRALTAYWTSTTSYRQAADGQVEAAVDLFGADSPQCAATLAAWRGVDVTPTRTCATIG